LALQKIAETVQERQESNNSDKATDEPEQHFNARVKASTLVCIFCCLF